MILRLRIHENQIQLDCDYRDTKRIIEDIEYICKDIGCDFDNKTMIIIGGKRKLYDFLHIISGWYDCFIE